MKYEVSGKLLKNIKRKKVILDKNRPLNSLILRNLLEWFRVELTYSSNAIEGNTLSRLETAVILQQGITIGGKLIKEHLEATNHAKAFDFILSLVNNKLLCEQDILKIHKMVLSSIEEDYAGKYRDVRVRIAGTDVIFPNHIKIPELMNNFISYINSDIDPLQKALYAHYEFVTIHPFTDGNGRTARLLMNLILMQNGFPPAIIKPRDRLKYLKALEIAQLGGEKKSYVEFILKSIDKSMDIYVNSIENKEIPIITPRTDLLKIGDLANATGETIATIRYWVKLGLLEISEILESGHQLFDKTQMDQCFKIRELQKKRFTLEEIAKKLSI